MSFGKSFISQLEYFNSQYQVFAPDLTGFGSNRGMPYAYSLDDYIESVKEYMYKHSIVRPHVIAHSFGARIVLKASSVDKKLFDKLVLTGAAGLKPKPNLVKSVKKATFKCLKRVFGKEKLKRFYSKEYQALSPVMQQSYLKIVNEHLDYTLEKIKNPTLLVFGKNDKETPLYMAKRLNEGIKNSKLIILNAGHFAFLDCPLKFNLEVKEFLL